MTFRIRSFARSVSALVVACLAAPASAETLSAPAPMDPAPPRAVLELFTSQGCGDCPAAEAILEGYAARADVIALALPVDYWDYLGWKDTMASARNSDRQRAYAARLDTGAVSTPQVILNGASAALGSSEDDIERAFNASETALQARRIPVSIRNFGPSLVIDIAARPGDEVRPSVIWLASIQKPITVDIRAGENAGKRVTYRNIVRELVEVGQWNGRTTTIRLETKAVLKPEIEDVVVLVQEADAGPIIGAARLTPPPAPPSR